jgi:hypothetical protein
MGHIVQLKIVNWTFQSHVNTKSNKNNPMQAAFFMDASRWTPRIVQAIWNLINIGKHPETH